MALPKIDSPIFMLDIPSTKKELRYRPFTVKEEKLLLIVSQDPEDKDVENVIRQIINNCTLDDFDVDDATTYDIEYIFMKIRSKSVSNIVNINVKDDNDEEYYDVEIDLDKVEVQHNPEHTNIIQITDDICITMRDPTYKISKSLTGTDDDMINLIIHCIDEIMIDTDEVVLMKDHTKKEQEEFVNSFSSQTARDIEQFLSSAPKLSCDITYVKNDGTEVNKKLEGMSNFFT
jgi:hypothetical protein